MERLQSAEPYGEKVRYSVIYLVHGDSDYLYFDDGNAGNADEKVVKEARKIGEKAGRGEVFIFHQLPERKILWLFPQKDRRFLHYRNGELVRDKRYSPQRDTIDFRAESILYKRYSESGGSEVPVYMLYFGHEIPHKKRTGYHRSQPGTEIDIRSFTGGLRSFLPADAGKFDLTVLSSCNSGNPPMVNLLGAETEFLLTSPQNLHLSHIDSGTLTLLNSDPEQSPRRIAREMAESTFKRLSATLQTEITLTVYEISRIRTYLDELHSSYRNYLDEREPTVHEFYTDCTALPFFRHFEYEKGIHSWYRPARFGRKAGKKSHSGWSCLETEAK